MKIVVRGHEKLKFEITFKSFNSFILISEEHFVQNFAFRLNFKSLIVQLFLMSSFSNWIAFSTLLRNPISIVPQVKLTRVNSSAKKEAYWLKTKHSHENLALMRGDSHSFRQIVGNLRQLSETCDNCRKLLTIVGNFRLSDNFFFKIFMIFFFSVFT